MAARLIVNADDFGLTPGVNRAIAELHGAGAITSTTLMATGAAFDDAVSIACAHPTLGVGLHIVLTDGVPVCDPATLPTLCPNGRTFRPSLITFIRDLLLHRIDPAEIEHESSAQLHKVESAGIHVTHFDSHKHTHLFPAVATQLGAILRSSTSATLRNPFEPAFAKQPINIPIKRRLEIATLEQFRHAWQRATNGIRTTDGTIGISATGSLDDETLHGTLANIPHDGTYEILCHPGYNDADLDRVNTRLRIHREIEYKALLKEIPFLRSKPNPPHLIHYGEL